jgi:predicted amidohydrolase
MKIAAVNWKLREIKDEGEFADHLSDLLDQCTGCDLVVLPEMFSLEYLALATAEQLARPASYLANYEPLIEQMLTGLMDWANLGPTSSVLVAGSTPKLLFPQNRIRNRSHLIVGGMEEQRTFHQDKVVLTEWEHELGFDRGGGLTYLPRERVGVTICYDAEFPASGRALAEAGMLFQCVPAWTETMHGFQRVRWACQARAVENQVCVVHSSLVGKVGKEESHGSSAIIVPPHAPFPLNPILAETAMDEEGVAIAEVDPAALLKCREQGEVRNWRDRNAGDWTVTTV